jgi:hypothetical protein
MSSYIVKMTLSNFFELDPTFLNPTVVPGENVRALFIPLDVLRLSIYNIVIGLQIQPDSARGDVGDRRQGTEDDLS